MSSFHYIARSKNGERVEGDLPAPDKRAVIAQLARKGLTPVSIASAKQPDASPTSPASKSSPHSPAPQKSPPSSPSPRPPFSFSFRSKPALKMAAVLLFTRELTDLLSSGMTLGTALHSLAQRKTGKPQDAIFASIRDEIVSGSSLSSALSHFPESFPSLYVSMVRAGEASGQLPSVLERLVKHYERVLAAREKVVMALVYPCIVALVGFGAMLFMMLAVIPTFSKMFEELGGQLPLPTRILIGLSSGFLKYGWILLGATLAGVVLVRQLLKTPAGIAWKDRQLLRVPCIRGIVKANAFANFAHTLSTLLSNGVQVLQALSIVENTVGNSVVAAAIRTTKDKVSDGSSMSRPLAASGVFPRLLTDMLAIGEESGNITGALDHIGVRYDSELDRAVKIFTTVLEPVMMLFIAVGVGFVAISMLMAVFELTSGLQA